MVIGGAANGVPVALVGQTLAKMSAENGEVYPRRPVTTAGTAGHLMAADEKTPAAALVGISLGSLNSGTGMVMVLLK